MDRPDSSGEVLRAIAKGYRDEIGPARAEQLASRAMARAGETSHRYRRMGVLASSAALAASLVLVGVVVLTGGPGSTPSVDPGSPPVASGSAVAEGVHVPTLTREGLMEALDLIDQQRELEAAEVVIEALSYFAVSPNAIPSEVTIEAYSTPDAVSVGGQTPTSSPDAGVGSVDQDIYSYDPPPAGLDDPGGPVYEALDSHPAEGEEVSETRSSQEAALDPGPPIQELGLMLKLEVEELLGVLDISESDPDAITEAVEEVEKAVAPILEYHSQDEPTIIVTPPGDDGEE